MKEIPVLLFIPLAVLLVFQVAPSLGQTNQPAVPPAPVKDAGGLEITTPDGKTYKNCSISRIESDGIIVLHSKGIVKIVFEDLPDSLREKYQPKPAATAPVPEKKDKPAPPSAVAPAAVVPSTPGAAPVMDLNTASQNWKNDWPAFIFYLSWCYTNSVEQENEDPAAGFDNSMVTWEGAFVKFNSDEKPPAVELKMPALSLTLPDGHSITVDSLVVRPRDLYRYPWRLLKEGTKVQFKTILEKKPGSQQGAVSWNKRASAAGDAEYAFTISTLDGQLEEVFEKPKPGPPGAAKRP